MFSAISWAAGTLGGWLRRSDRALTVMNRVAETVLVGLAVGLAITER